MSFSLLDDTSFWVLSNAICVKVECVATLCFLECSEVPRWHV